MSRLCEQFSLPEEQAISNHYLGSTMQLTIPIDRSDKCQHTLTLVIGWPHANTVTCIFSFNSYFAVHVHCLAFPPVIFSWRIRFIVCCLLPSSFNSQCIYWLLKSCCFDTALYFTDQLIFTSTGSFASNNLRLLGRKIPHSFAWQFEWFNPMVYLDYTTGFLPRCCVRLPILCHVLDCTKFIKIHLASPENSHSTSKWVMR